MDLRYERRAWTLIYLCLGLVEGGTAAVMVRALFGDQAPAFAVDIVLAVVSSAPAWSNLFSMQYARRAQGRPKIAFLFPLLVAMTVCVAAIALVPKSGLGLVLFFMLYASARLLWAGVETVRAVLWSVNYPTRLRARITGRIQINTSIAVAAAGLAIGWLLGQEGPWWRLAMAVGAAFGIAGAFAFRQFRVRREADLLQAERTRVQEGASFGLAGMRALLAHDPVFREYQLGMSLFGAGILSLTPLLVVCLNDVLGVAAFTQVLVTTTLPILMVPLAVQPWARYLDTHRVLAFRALHGKIAIVAVALLAAAIALQVPMLLWPGSLLLGRLHGGGRARLDDRAQRLRAARRGDALHGPARDADRHARPGGAAAHDRRVSRARIAAGRGRGRRAPRAARTGRRGCVAVRAHAPRAQRARRRRDPRAPKPHNSQLSRAVFTSRRPGAVR